VGVTSATPLRAIPGLGVYSAARGAKNAFLQVAGTEAAPHSVQVNATGIPAGRIGDGQEAAELVLAFTTGASGFLAGRVIPISGG